jgi:hypothetical protein
LPVNPIPFAKSSTVIGPWRSKAMICPAALSDNLFQ